MEWETVVGLEIHAQLATRSKIFSGSSTAYGAAPNVQANLVDLGYPGVLPVLNREAVRMAVKFGLAVGGRVARRSIFARKNYFYPDLPKGYQISQYEQPIVEHGTIAILLEDGTRKVIGVTRAHLEEDAGKSLHEGLGRASGIDLNRAGTPLLEIVSEPDMRSAREAIAYMKKVHTLVRYLEICDGNMQEGSFRCDANVSVRPKGAEAYGTRCEIKNLNSFRYVERAINHEVERQVELIEGGGKVVQETRLFDPDRNETRPMRSKEEANDYRYFPDPDLLPLVIEDAFVEDVRAGLPELPDAKAARFAREHGLSEYDAGVLTASRELAAYYEEVAAGAGEPKLAANWVMGELSGFLNRDGLEVGASPVTAAGLAGMLKRITDGTISGKLAKDVFEAMWAERKAADAIIDSRGLRQITDTGAIEQAIAAVLAANPGQLADYRAGKDKLFGFFVGQVMKATAGKANPAPAERAAEENALGIMSAPGDLLHRFLFERLPVRGHLVRLDASWRAAIEHQSYPDAVTAALGEAMAASVLMAGALKFEGRLSLQFEGPGPVRLMLAQCTHRHAIRGVARHDALPPDDTLADDLFGDGQLAVTIEQTEGGERYQGVVPLVTARLADCLEQYFERSEQLPSRLVLAATPDRAAGLLLQRVAIGAAGTASERAEADDAWLRLGLLAATVSPKELFDLPCRELLRRLFPEDDIRLFEGAPVFFQCTCSRERVSGILQALGGAEVHALLDERGDVEVRCEFCNRAWRFDAVDVAALFSPGATQSAPPGLH